VGEVEGVGVLALRQAQGQDDRGFGWVEMGGGGRTRCAIPTHRKERLPGVCMGINVPPVRKERVRMAPGNGGLKLSAVWVVLEEGRSVASTAAALRPAAARCALCAGCFMARRPKAKALGYQPCPFEGLVGDLRKPVVL
jgi:hypothetical protein